MTTISGKEQKTVNQNQEKTMKRFSVSGVSTKETETRNAETDTSFFNWNNWNWNAAMVLILVDSFGVLFLKRLSH